jgi:hypothetical protein
VYDRRAYFDEKKRAFEALAVLVDRIVNPVDNVCRSKQPHQESASARRLSH